MATEQHTKSCKTCGGELPLACFRKSSAHKDGLFSECRECEGVRVRAYRMQNGDSIRAATRRRKQKNREELLRKRREYFSKNRVRLLEQIYEWKRQNNDVVKEFSKRYYAANKTTQKAKARQWYLDNRERAAQSRAAWKSENRGSVAESNKNRWARKIHATPIWASRDAIREVYKEAARITAKTGVIHHVDHIIPLRSKIVCGLHCEANLRIITAAENLSKATKLIPALLEAA